MDVKGVWILKVNPVPKANTDWYFKNVFLQFLGERGDGVAGGQSTPLVDCILPLNCINFNINKDYF